MLKLAAAVGTVTLLALGAGGYSTPAADCSMTVTEEAGQITEQVMCDDGSSLQLTHSETYVREKDGE